METCPNCGRELPDATATICPFCQTELTPEQETTATVVGGSTDKKVDVQQVSSAESAETESSEQDTMKESDSEKVEADKADEKNSAKQKIDSDQIDITAIIRDYGVNLNNNVRHPQLDQHQHQNRWDGLVNLIIVGLFTALGLTRFFSKLVSKITTSMSSLMGGSSSSQTSFTGFFSIIAWLLIDLLIVTAVLYVFQKVVYHEDITFRDTLNTIFVPTSLAVYVSIVAFIIVLVLQPSIYVACLVLIPLFLVKINFVCSRWISSGKSADHQRFYLVTIAILVALILSMIVSRIFVGNIVSQLMSQLNLGNLFSGLLGNSL